MFVVLLTPLTDSKDTFEGCISRVKFNNIYPLKIYFTPTPPDYVTNIGNMQKSRCRVEEEIPKVAVPDNPGPVTPPMTTADTNPLPPGKQTLTPGDQAAIACKYLDYIWQCV